MSSSSAPPLVRPAALGPDPRILARRIAVRRDEGRRRLRRLLWAAGALTLVAAAAAATRTPLLDVDRVRVAGTDRVPAELVVGAAAEGGAVAGEALASLDTGSVARAVEALPGIAEAHVERKWPGTVVIEVIERVPVAGVATADRVALVAADGVVVDVVGDPPAGLPRIEVTGEHLTPGAVLDTDDLLAVAAALSLELAADVATVEPGGSAGEVDLRLTDGGVVRLGPAADLGAKLVAVATVLGHADRGCLGVLDVRVPSAPAVTPARGCSS